MIGKLLGDALESQFKEFEMRSFKSVFGSFVGLLFCLRYGVIIEDSGC